MSNLVMIEGIDIRQDHQGRYSLNDLHRASGGERRHGPSLWLENQQTKELIAELALESGDTGFPVSVVRGGTGQGSYTCRELVYAYAMWISPAFHLKVIRAYDRPQASPKSQAEILLASAQALVELERQQRAMVESVARVEHQVQDLRDTMLMSTRPQNAEAISHIRPRMWQKYGIPSHVVDTVLRQLPYSPKPAGMVRNSREEAEGATYAVYWTKDVNTVFARFVGECSRVTPAFVTHPHIEDRFRLTPGAEGRAA